MKKKSKAKPSTIRDVSMFNGIKWDGLGIETLNTVSKAILNITELFKAQNVTVEAGIKIVHGEPIGDPLPTPTPRPPQTRLKGGKLA